MFVSMQRIDLDFSGIIIEDISAPGSFKVEALFRKLQGFVLFMLSGMKVTFLLTLTVGSVEKGDTVMNVVDVMTTNVITITAEQTKQQAARLLSQHRISGLPVVNAEQRVVGIVTEYDVIGKQGHTVGEIMTRGIISVTPDTDLDEVGHLLVHKNIKRVPVLDQGKLVGIVSRADLVKEVALRWVCPVCGEMMHSEEQPERCPRCGANQVAASFEQQSPGS
jgi:CBS domain-containing protein